MSALLGERTEVGGAASWRWPHRNPWVAFALRQCGILLGGLLVLVLGSFLMVHFIPGDPAVRLAGLNASPDYVRQVRESMGLDQPMLVQLWDYVRGLFTLDLGTSIANGRPVAELVGDRLPNTAKLAGVAFLFAVLLSVPPGIIAGALTSNGRHRRLELAFTAVTGAAAAIPGFIAATYLAYIFAVKLGWLPVAGTGGWRALILPAIAIAAPSAASLARIVRVQTLNVLSQDYMRTARSKRLPARLFYARHALPNLLTAALTIGGLLFAGLLGGSVIVENVFAWPGLGTAVVQAIQARDFPVIRVMLLLLGAAVLVVNMLVDVLLAAADPRSAVEQV